MAEYLTFRYHTAPVYSVFSHEEVTFLFSTYHVVGSAPAGYLHHTLSRANSICSQLIEQFAQRLSTIGYQLARILMQFNKPRSNKQLQEKRKPQWDGFYYSDTVGLQTLSKRLHFAKYLLHSRLNYTLCFDWNNYSCSLLFFDSWGQTGFNIFLWSRTCCTIKVGWSRQAVFKVGRRIRIKGCQAK